MSFIVGLLIAGIVSSYFARRMRRTEHHELVHGAEEIFVGAMLIGSGWAITTLICHAVTGEWLGFGLFAGLAFGWIVISTLYLRKSKKLADTTPPPRT